MTEILLSILVVQVFFGLVGLSHAVNALKRIEQVVQRWSKVHDLDSMYRAALDHERGV